MGLPRQYGYRFTSILTLAWLDYIEVSRLFRFSHAAIHDSAIIDEIPPGIASAHKRRPRAWRIRAHHSPRGLFLASPACHNSCRQSPLPISRFDTRRRTKRAISALILLNLWRCQRASRHRLRRMLAGGAIVHGRRRYRRWREAEAAHASRRARTRLPPARACGFMTIYLRRYCRFSSLRCFPRRHSTSSASQKERY